jgi:hypothetical protein
MSHRSYGLGIHFASRFTRTMSQAVLGIVRPEWQSLHTETCWLFRAYTTSICPSQTGHAARAGLGDGSRLSSSGVFTAGRAILEFSLPEKRTKKPTAL